MTVYFKSQTDPFLLEDFLNWSWYRTKVYSLYLLLLLFHDFNLEYFSLFLEMGSSKSLFTYMWVLE